MNTNKFVFSVIAVVVALVMLGSCLVPVVTSAIDGEPVTKTLNNTITGSKSVYRMVSGDTILTEVSAGDFSITSGANTYTTTDQVILVDPDYGLFVPSFDDHNVTIYSNNGITTIDSELGYSVDKIYVGPRTTFFIDSGKLYGMGANANGQQGDGTTTDVTTPTQIGSFENVTDVVCSSNSAPVSGTGVTFFIDSGKLYGMGANARGQQGNGTTTDVTTPTQIGSFENVTDVVCSLYTTFFIDSGKLYGMGQNNKGQQGNGTTTDVTTPTQIGSFENVTDVVCSSNTTFFIDSGKLYGMGENEYGQQGNGTTTDVTTPTQVATPLSYGDIQIYYTDSEITIMSTNIEGQETVYLVSSISELNDHLYVVEDTEGYYAAPSSLVSYNFDASSFYVGTGSTVDRSYGVNVTITKNTGSDTILSSGYGVYLYDNGTAPLTINGFSGLYAIVEESYSGTVQEGGVGEGSLFAILLTLTVTLTIIGVVIGIVRRIGGEDY